ncbi:MAG TPA: FtsX-like permease family protein [Gaiellaceae bacterium]|nr:FtsX-like permease family protein [Gaiellaceae bacterium]
MMRVALKGMLGRKLRATLTGFAIVLGVAMVSGSFILTDTIDKSLGTIFDESYAASDVVVSSRDALSEDAESGSAPFPDSVLADVAALPEVEAASGSIEDEATLIDAKGEAIGAGMGLAMSVDPPADEQFNPLRLVEGAWPEGSGEIAVDKATADEQGLAVGDSIGAATDGPVETYSIAGIVRYGSVESLGGATIAAFDLATAQQLFDKQDQLDLVRVAAAEGVNSEQLAVEIRPLLPETAQVRTAEAQADTDSEDTQAGVNVFRYFLLGFGGIALFVGSFVIANTLSITVAQRVRELATLRTLGASRRQVLWSVVLEAFVVGAIASVVGLFVGLGIAVALNALLEATGIDLPQTGIVFSTRTIVVSLLVGTLIALLASLRPALRATRVPPIAAVREGAVLPPSRLARYGLVTSLALVAVSVALLAYGVLADGVGTRTRLLAIGVGVLLLFIGVTLVAPRLVRPLAAGLGAPAARFGGSAGRLARDNSTRNPARTASTAAALMIGIALVTFVSLLAQGLKSSFSDAVDELFVADYSLTAEGDFGSVSDATVAAARETPGVTAVSAIRTGEGRAFGSTVGVNGVDENLSAIIDMSWAEGSADVPAQLGREGAFVKDDYADEHGLRVGSPIELKTPTGDVLDLTVHGIFAEPKGGSPFGEVAISTATFDGAYAEKENEWAFLNMEGGVTDENTATLSEAVAPFPDARVETREEFKSSRIGELSTFVNLLYALLGLSVLVSLFGIVNTLVLSVFERTRELGMLRAIGMTRRQVRRMIRQESVITALIGATLGIVIGVFLAFLVTQALSDEGIVFAIPVGSLVVFVLVAIAAGMLAAIFPARRASKLNVLEALQYE